VNIKRSFSASGRVFTLMLMTSGLLFLAGCSSNKITQELPSATGNAEYSTRYRIAPLDTLQVFVWRNPEVSTSVTVRPDGLMTAPLLEEVPAAGKTPQELARDVEKHLSTYLRDPLVTIIASGFQGTFRENIRVVGEAAEPKSILYRDSMTLLDLMIDVGGMTEFADGNNTVIVRVEDGVQNEYRVRMDDLIRDGDISANIDMKPGDIVIIPEAWF
jgi:polysaccharide export outer membrane protein